MLESPGLASISRQRPSELPMVSVHCLSYDDQCLLPALPEVQVKTKQNQTKQVTFGGLLFLGWAKADKEFKSSAVVPMLGKGLGKTELAGAG